MRSEWVVLAAAVVVLSGCIKVNVPTDPVSDTTPLDGDKPYAGPLVEFTWQPTTPEVGDGVRFDPTVQVLKGTSIATWLWDFGDGSTSSRTNPTHEFLSAGPKTVTLTVRSSDDFTAKASHVVPVGAATQGPSGNDAPGQPGEPDLPDPVIAAVPNGRDVRFSFTWSAEPDRIGWDFGDGSTSNESAPIHTYATAGSYEVALHVLLGTTIRSDVASVVAGTPYRFAESVVGVAVDRTGDLYEPTIEVSDTGVVYITGHTIAVDTTGAPVYFSKDDGATWKQLPFSGSTSMPGDTQGATPPPSDEIFLVAGDDGWLYGVDITLATYPVNAWSGDGAEHSYHNPNAYNEAQNVLQATCTPAPIKDRPWGAYSNGTLLMVNNQGGLFPAQVGVLQVPPELPLGLGAGTVEWNLCAGRGGSIPGIPDIRADGVYVAPQISDGSLYLVVGHKSDVLGSHVVEVFPVETEGEITSVYGIAAFDRQGTLFVGVSDNEAAGESQQQSGLQMASSRDGGATFVTRFFATGDADAPVRHFYMDPNDFGPGALVVWAVDGDTEDTFDWYTAHVQLGADGGPVLETVLLAIDEGPMPSAHVTGAAVGPDGRAYLAMHRGSSSTPLSVFIQQDGPTLPLATA